MGLLIVGGGPAGLAAARAYREAGGDGAVTLLTPERDAPYMRPALSKEFLRGESEADAIALEEDAWYAEHDVVVRHGITATALDPAARIVEADGERFAYDACLLATGAEPAPLPVPGADDALYLRSLDTARTLRERAEQARSAVVVGSGFIGCEVAASLTLRGLRVTLVSDERVPQGQRLGEEAGHRIGDWLTEMGVALRLGAGCDAIGPHMVRVPGKPPIEADLVLVGGGIRPRVQLAEAAGLDTHEGRIVTDERMRTSAEGVYAAGDVALARNAAAGRPLAVEHWGEALNQGETAGRSAAGEDAEWDVAPGFWSAIGPRTLKHVAWGDGFDEARFVTHPGGAFTVWYGSGGTTVGVLAHESDDDYERGRELIEQGQPLP
jgi:3-phenylpropionate/trans-cinnamate dioxygenase ferredoxin reductase subunit